MYHAGGRVRQSPVEGLTPPPRLTFRRWASCSLLTRSGGTRRGAWRGKGPGTCVSGAPAAASAGYLAVVTETGGLISVTESAGRIRAGLARRYGPSLVLLEHDPAPGSGAGMEALDLVRVGADGSPHWSRVWPAPEENPRHAGLERWMAGYGHQIAGRPRAGSIGVTALTGDCSWRPRDVVRPGGSGGGGHAAPRDGGSALAVRGRGRWRPARGPAPRHRRRRRARCLRRRVRRRHRRGDGQPGRDGLTRPSPAGYIWPWRTGPAGS